MSEWARNEMMRQFDAREERLDAIRATGLGRDGNYHDDPCCAAIAPLDSYEASHGEPCNMCQRRARAAAFEEYVTDEALEHAGCDEDCHEDDIHDKAVE